MDDTSLSVPKPTPVRLWIPLCLLLLATVAGGTIWYWPSLDWERSSRVSLLSLIVLATFLLLSFWILFLRRLPILLRTAVIAAAVLAGPLLVREVRFTGDMMPTFLFRFGTTADDILEAHRRQQSATTAEATDEGGEIWRHLQAMDFPGYLGPDRNGFVWDTTLRTDWQSEPPRQLWKQPVGGGYAGFAIVRLLKARGLLVTVEQRRDEEAVVAYDADTGKELWLHSYRAHFAEKLGGPGPRATPTIAGVGARLMQGYLQYHVFSLGATGQLVCLDAETGKPQWSANILEKNDNIAWAMSGSPLVDDNLVYVAPGVQKAEAKGRGVIAYDRTTGKEVWTSGNHRGGYSSPMIATLCERRTLLVFDGDGLSAYDPKNGAELWHYPWETMPPQYINVAQPLVLSKDRIFLSSGYGVGCAMLQVKGQGDRWTLETLWQNKQMRCKFTSPVALDGFLYGLDEGILVCLDEKNGQRRWKDGRYGHGQILLVEKKILVLSESGELILVDASPDGFREHGRISAVSGKTWNPLAFTSGYALVRNDREMACFALPGERHGINSNPCD